MFGYTLGAPTVGAWLVLALLVKHFVADVWLQPLWMSLNKGTFLHPGGLAHAGLHGLFTGLVLLAGTLAGVWPVTVGIMLMVAAVDAVVHYGIDWSKMNIDKRFRFSHLLYGAEDGSLTPDSAHGTRPLRGRLVTSDRYYWSLVADQCLHFATYVVLGDWVVRHI